MWRVVLLIWWLLGSLASCCPQHCRCYTDDDDYKVANCSKSGLTSGELAPTIDVLNFKNQLRGSQTKLEPKVFQNFRGLRELNVQNASIAHLPNEVFHGLSRVVRIDLSFNKIRHLNGVVFKPLPNLRSLSLRGNFLNLSPLEVIVSQTLQDLDMGFCSLTNIPLYTFSSTPSLRHLILDGNFIQVIEYNVLPKGLTYLNLANNQIVNPPINVFNSLLHLLRLDISQNPTNCSCSLLVFQDALSGRAGLLDNDVVCANPAKVQGKNISSINENQLCIDDYYNREGLSGYIRSRNRGGHHHHDVDQVGYLSDGPLMKDAEVMFSNDETNQMGTHMEDRASHAPSDFTDTSDELLETMDVDDLAPDETLVESTRSTSSEGISRVDNIINLSTSDPNGLNDHSNTLHVIDPTNSTSSQVSEPLSEPQSPDFNWITNTTSEESSLETLPESFSDPETLSHMMVDETTTESEVNLDKRFALPTAIEPSDYNYDAQHVDYAENVTSAEVVDDSWKALPDQYESSSKTYELNDEGSGEAPDEVVTESNIASSSTIGFMEERETDTELPLKTVSDDLVDWSSTPSDDLVDLSSTPSDNLVVGVTDETILEETATELPSSTEPSTEEPTVVDDVEVFATDPTTEISEELSSTAVVSSSEPSTEVLVDMATTEPSMAASSSSEPFTVTPVDASSSELPTDVPSSETPTELPSFSEDPTLAPTTDPTTEVALNPIASSELSSERTSTAPSVDEFTTQPASSSSWTPIVSRDWWDSDEVVLPPVASSTERVLSLSTLQKSGKTFLFATEASKIPNDVEWLSTVDESSLNGNIVVTPGPAKSVLTSSVAYIIIGLLVALVIILLSIIVCRKKSTNKKFRLPKDAEAATGTELQDMLLPKPHENGVKVLPNNYTNGSAPVSNGKPHEPEPDKEETVPVLAPEPDEPDSAWEEKPEPIEAVTARLTMLARPQTPIFIQKSQT